MLHVRGSLADAHCAADRLVFIGSIYKAKGNDFLKVFQKSFPRAPAASDGGLE